MAGCSQLYALLTDSKPYVGNDSRPMDRDPTYGRIDADIQRHVDRMKPESLATRVALENTFQNYRNRNGCRHPLHIGMESCLHRHAHG